MWNTLKVIFKFILEDGEPKDGPTAANLPLTGAALPVILINLAYIVFVFRLGPKLMENRKPFNLKYVMAAYNLIQIAFNLYINVATVFICYVEPAIEMGCMMKLSPDNRHKPNEVHLFYCYYINKLMDYTDTIFFVLRKSYKQVSFLHVYHHILMYVATYIYIRAYGFGGHCATVGIFNTVVHVFMYAYYFMRAWSPQVKETIKWKKMITKLQMAQFCIIFIYNVYPLYFRPDCQYPKGMLRLVAVQAVVMFGLFANFYYQTYIKIPSKPKQISKSIKAS